MSATFKDFSMIKINARRELAFLLTLALLVASTGSFAAIEAQQFDDPKLEARYTVLIKEFRCLVCQNQSVAESDAELAQDVRQKTADLLRAGASDDEIRTYMQERFGDFVLYRTPLKGSTLFIWIGPIAVLLLALIGFFWHLRQRPTQKVQSNEPTKAEIKRARGLLNSDTNKLP